MANSPSATTGSKRSKLLAVAVAAIAAALATMFFTRSEGTPPQEKKEPLVAVVAAPAVRKTIPVQLKSVGTVNPFATVAVKSRIDGQLVGVHFREGQDVKKGELLFTIDPRPHQVALQEAQARLDRDTALAEKAGRDALRYAELAAKDFVSNDKFEQFRANAEALRATVAADRASVERARLQLEYCYIKAPMAGRTGRLMVDEGSQVKANDDRTSMVEIAQILPIHVAFSVPQQYLSEIKTHMAREALSVEAFAPESRDTPETGTLSFLDNKVNSQTGTVMLKGTFANTERRLWPGQFVTTILTLTRRHDTVLVPSQAVQTGQSGLFVYVVRADMTVELRPIVTGMTIGEEVVVEQGVEADERVVTEGQLRLVPGAKVQIAG